MSGLPPGSPSTPSFRARMIDTPALVSALIAGVILAILGFLVGIYSQLVTAEALRTADEQYLSKLQTVFQSATDKVLEQSKSFSDLSRSLGQAQAGAELAAKQAQSAAADAATASDTAKQRLTDLDNRFYGKLAEAIINLPSFQTFAAHAADNRVTTLDQDMLNMREQVRQIQEHVGSAVGIFTVDADLGSTTCGPVPLQAELVCHIPLTSLAPQHDAKTTILAAAIAGPLSGSGCSGCGFQTVTVRSVTWDNADVWVWSPAEAKQTNWKWHGNLIVFYSKAL